MKFIHSRKNWKLILEARDNRRKIKKFFNSDEIADWAHSLDENYSIWIANTFKNAILDKLEETGAFTGKGEFKWNKGDAIRLMKQGNDVDEKEESKSDRRLYQKISKFADVLKDRLTPKYRYVFDWTRARMRDADVRENLKGMTLEEAWNKSDEWHKSLAEGDHVIIDEQGEIIMTFKDDFYWIDLETSSCSDEGEAMGHCGSTSYGTTLYSLRKNKKPHVTLALNERTGMITQLKGKGNEKPVEKYHPYIVDLLINPNVEIEGFDYEYNPQEDFQISDLNDELFEKLYKGNKEIFNNSKGFLTLTLYDRGLIGKEELAEKFNDVVLDEETGNLYFTVGDWADSAELVFEDGNNRNTLDFARSILSHEYDSALWFDGSEEFDFDDHWKALTVDTLNVVKSYIIENQTGSFYNDEGEEIEFTFTEDNLIVDEYVKVHEKLHPGEKVWNAEKKKKNNIGGMYFYVDGEIYDMADILKENKDFGGLEDIVYKFNQAASDANRWSIESEWFDKVSEMVIYHITQEHSKDGDEERFKFFNNNTDLGFKLNVNRVMELMEYSEEGEAMNYDNIEDVYTYISNNELDDAKINHIDERGIYGDVEKEINETLINIL